MPTTPDRRDDLRAIAKALAGAPRGASERKPPPPRRRSPWLVYIAVAVVAAAATHTIRILADCGLGMCPEPETAAAPTPVRDAILARRAEPAPAPVATAERDAVDDVELGRRVAAADVKTILAVERDARPSRSPTPASRRGAGAATPAPSAKERRHPTVPPAAVPPTPVASEPARADTAAEPDDETAPNISGRWMLTNAIHRTSHSAFRGLRIRFRIELEQHGDTITGRGRKFTIDDRPIPPAERSEIVFDGTVRGRDVIMRFVEHGARRDSNGRVRWRISSDGQSLEGTFDSSAADSAGRSHANRES